MQKQFMHARTEYGHAAPIHDGAKKRTGQSQLGNDPYDIASVGFCSLNVPNTLSIDPQNRAVHPYPIDIGLFSQPPERRAYVRIIGNERGLLHFM